MCKRVKVHSDEQREKIENILFSVKFHIDNQRRFGVAAFGNHCVPWNTCQYILKGTERKYRFQCGFAE